MSFETELLVDGAELKNFSLNKENDFSAIYPEFLPTVRYFYDNGEAKKETINYTFRSNTPTNPKDKAIFEKYNIAMDNEVGGKYLFRISQNSSDRDNDKKIKIKFRLVEAFDVPKDDDLRDERIKKALTVVS